MKLHWSPRSPFVRKVVIVLHETGLADRVELVRTPVSFARPPEPAILADNPLGKIPTLVLDGGEGLFDSRVICAYLDTLHDGPRLLPETGRERFQQLRWEALGDGIAEILLHWQLERLRPGPEWESALAGFRIKLAAGLARIEADLPQLRDGFGLGQIAIFCCLGHLEFRFGDSRWREAHPAISGWFDEVSGRASVQAAPLVDEPGATAAADRTRGGTP